MASAPQSDLIYLFGGREGRAMSACSGDLWIYSISKDQWSQKTVEEIEGVDGERVERRSYHVMAATLEDKVYCKSNLLSPSQR
jgi:hypothetical protein